MRDPGDQLSLSHFLRLKCLLHGAHGGDRNGGFAQHRQPLLARLLAELAVDEGRQLLAIAGAIGIGCKVCMIDQIGPLQRSHQALIGPIIGTCDVERTVRGIEHARRRAVGAVVAEADQGSCR